MVEITENHNQMWRLVPDMVRRRFSVADEIAGALTKQAVDAWYYPREKVLRVVGAAPVVKLASVREVVAVDAAPADLENAICIKQASTFSYLGSPFRLAGSLQGGPSPLTNAIVGGLLAGGLGYGSGALLEHLFPERYVERGKLRRSLGMLGLGMGVVPGLMQWNANYNNRVGAGKPATWGTFGKALVAPTESTPHNPGAAAKIQQYNNFGKFDNPLKVTADVDPLFKNAAEKFASMFSGEDSTGLGIKPIPVDSFNQAIWNDVRPGAAASNPFGTRSRWGEHDSHMYTPPYVAAAATGLVSGVQSQYGGAPLLSPMHFVRGLATAGVDLATARVAGSVLGALGGLTPDAQSKLQDMGLWGGLIRGVTGSVLGLR
jgi:hypothetical protein